jgi:hypothetical protein
VPCSATRIMATIKIEKSRFAVQFDGRGADGKNDHFRSFYTLAGKPIAIRQRDTRPIGERYGMRSKDMPRTSALQAIYGSYSRTTGGYLVFVDKLEAESQVFMNWRTGSMRAYRRVPIGRIRFLTYGPKPRPAISDVVSNSGCLFIAWITDGSPTGDLICRALTRRRALGRTRSSPVTWDFLRWFRSHIRAIRPDRVPLRDAGRRRRQD